MPTSSTAPKTALVVVDIQNDFTEGGALAVTGGDRVAQAVGGWAAQQRGQYALIVTTQDFHTDPGEHFAAPGTEPNFATSWPVHCVAGADGADLDPLLDLGAGGTFTDLVDLAIYKGHYSAAYSGFEGTTAATVPTGFVPEPGNLTQLLREAGVAAVDVVGLATDHCVRATALDALQAGFEVRVLSDLCAGVADESTAAALAELSDKGATVTLSR